MSVSFSIFSTIRPDINIPDWIQGANICLKNLLNQTEDFSVDLEVFCGTDVVNLFVPSEKIFGFVEKNFLDRGGVISYGLLDYWELDSDVPLFCFCISEIPRETDDLLLVLCHALLISAAKFMGATEIVDYHGIFNSNSDETSIVDLMSLKIDRPATLDEALKEFYKKLPIRRVHVLSK
ncbi:hypothetical protein [Duganella sp. CF458]|uniref:hypothetical protein n=1 Tax=Duganella sp. CF458 TaxID=1884368 RepID=UPI000B891071|nr:hypothetical protein [Duganella sp. CF458]